jgi:hypothetical protein
VEGEGLVWGQLQAGVAPGEFGHRDLGLQLAEVRAQAVVQALTEGQVAFGVRSVQVELAGLVERCFIPARRGQPQEQSGP